MFAKISIAKDNLRLEFDLAEKEGKAERKKEKKSLKILKLFDCLLANKWAYVFPLSKCLIDFFKFGILCTKTKKSNQKTRPKENRIQLNRPESSAESDDDKDSKLSSFWHGSCQFSWHFSIVPSFVRSVSLPLIFNIWRLYDRRRENARWQIKFNTTNENEKTRR